MQPVLLLPACIHGNSALAFGCTGASSCHSGDLLSCSDSFRNSQSAASGGRLHVSLNQPLHTGLFILQTCSLSPHTGYLRQEMAVMVHRPFQGRLEAHCSVHGKQGCPPMRMQTTPTAPASRSPAQAPTPPQVGGLTGPFEPDCLQIYAAMGCTAAWPGQRRPLALG